MRKFVPLFLALLVAAISVSAAAQAQQQQQTQQAPPTPPKPPRVVGQARSQEEFEAYGTIERAVTPQERAQLAEKFVEKFPDSGLTPLAHQAAAISFQEINNYEKFVEHAEKTLVELPNNVGILSRLAVAYADRGLTEQARARADNALGVVNSMTKPPQLTQAQWDAALDQVRADASYAIGTAFLDQFMKTAQLKAGTDVSSDLNLKQAVENLEKAALLDPAYDRAYYRLGVAYAKRNDADNAIKNLARAVGVEGPVSSIAREELKRIYAVVHKKTEGLDQAIAQERDDVQKKIAERRAKLQEGPQAPAPPQ